LSKFDTSNYEIRYRLKTLANRLWDKGYRPLSRLIRDGQSTFLDERVEVILYGESDEVMRTAIESLMADMPRLIIEESGKYSDITLGVVVSNRY
jgi:hypothetical protein